MDLEDPDRDVFVIAGIDSEAWSGSENDRSGLLMQRVIKVNGVDIMCLEHLVGNKNEIMVIELSNGYMLHLNNCELMDAAREE